MNMDDGDKLDTYKIIMVGQQHVGKTGLFGRFTRNDFNEVSQTTIGIEFGTKIVDADGKQLHAQVWDTSGEEKFMSITKAYYQSALGALLVYDITNRSSFEKLDFWLQNIYDNGDSHMIVMVVGNKSDLRHMRAVTKLEGEEYARKKGLGFVETSAKDSTNVDVAYQRLLSEIHRMICQSVIGGDTFSRLGGNDRIRLDSSDVQGKNRNSAQKNSLKNCSC
mmetsp:Transcript_49717/g.57045  ORF Transcript_49717/g.57045 Transcript_49717/m.57045 type:complete len:221 (+) Transcript_49717:47-709(+)